jgi:hypothetical protein
LTVDCETLSTNGSRLPLLSAETPTVIATACGLLSFCGIACVALRSTGIRRPSGSGTAASALPVSPKIAAVLETPPRANFLSGLPFLAMPLGWATLLAKPRLGY